MAYYKKTKPKKKSNKYTSIEKLAYQIGQIEKGLKNPKSKVYESYHKGHNVKSSQKKPLF
mgnify:CR=1 FL=1